MPEPLPTGRPAEDHAPVPFFGTWKAIYAAVALSAVVVMALLALFSRWPF